MTAPLRDRYELAVIELALDLVARLKAGASEDTFIRISLKVEGETLYQESIASSVLRLPPTLAAIAANAGVRTLDMPDEIVAGLARCLQSWPNDRPVWLHLGSPTGHLSAVAWENVLQRALDVPMLRMPAIGLPAVAVGGMLEIVICASASQPDAPYDLHSCLMRVIDQVRDTRPGETRIQVFTNDKRERARLRSNHPDIHVHTPPRALPSDGRPRQMDFLENGWLRWMAQAIGDEAAIDVVHFICPGHLSASYGALKLDEPAFRAPRSVWSVVHSAELVAFLTSVGAAAAAFTIPTTRAWPAGIRVLAHNVMGDLTGPVLVDAPHHDIPGSEALGDLYRMLFGAVEFPAPRSPGLAAYVHPQWAHRAYQPPRRRHETGFDPVTGSASAALTLAAMRFDDSLALDAEPPRWLGANQRVLEQLASEIVDPIVVSEHRAASDQGVKDALSFLRDVLGKDVERFKQSKGGGPESW